VPETGLQVALMEIGPQDRVVKREPREQQVAELGLKAKENWKPPYERPKIYELDEDMTLFMVAFLHLQGPYPCLREKALSFCHIAIPVGRPESFRGVIILCKTTPQAAAQHNAFPADTLKTLRQSIADLL
jgi:hypothetical protein